MVEFCPECGNMLRKKPCPCGYIDPETQIESDTLLQIWAPPSPNIIYCRITGIPYDKLKLMLNKGIYLEKLKEIKHKIRNHLYSCTDCVYYHEKIFHCKLKNKYLRKDSICKSFEPYEKI